jgi:hypothetical protein
MKPVDNLMFASVKMPIIDKRQAAQEILAIDENCRFTDRYRNISMIPLMTKSGEAGRYGTDNKNNGELGWVSYTPKIISSWFDEVVFPWIGGKGRIMALLTHPGEQNNEHIDCDRHQLNTLQHKFRLVIQGKTSTLYFITDKGHVRPPDVDGAFIMDGGWPHGMNNFTDEIKITLALGAPWNGKDNYGDDLIHHLNRHDYLMPESIEQYWNS